MVRTIETMASVAEDGTLTARLPADVPPGEHRVVVIIDESGASSESPPPLRFAAYPVGLLTPGMTFRREDLYDGDESEPAVR